MQKCPKCGNEMKVIEYDMALYPVYHCRPCDYYLDASEYLLDLYNVSEEAEQDGTKVMIYEPNTVDWQPGDIVIHDSDAKEPKMLMRVIAVTVDKMGIEMIDTEYIRDTNKRCSNLKEYLHDPDRFGINYEQATPEAIALAQQDWEKAHYWNWRHKQGAAVRKPVGDGSFDVSIATKAYTDEFGRARVHLVNGKSWRLDEVETIE